MKKVKSAVTASVASLGLVVGLASFAGAASGTIDTTGPDSVNKIRHVTRNHTRVENRNNVSATNSNDQEARSGNATTRHNTRAGDARTGNASNANSLNASMTVENRMPTTNTNSGSSNSSATIRETGPDSYNSVKTVTKNTVNVTNDNNLTVSNDNYQSAHSGDATVEDNTRGGSAMSGNASNTNSTTMTFRVSN